MSHCHIVTCIPVTPPPRAAAAPADQAGPRGGYGLAHQTDMGSPTMGPYPSGPRGGGPRRQAAVRDRRGSAFAAWWDGAGRVELQEGARVVCARVGALGPRPPRRRRSSRGTPSRRAPAARGGAPEDSSPRWRPLICAHSMQKQLDYTELYRSVT
jgi:hypothetical protein